MGMFLVLLPTVIWLFTGHTGFALVYGGVALLIFGLPLSLSYLELQRNISEQQQI